MKLLDEFREYLEETDNIYDLIGNCFGLLCDNISNHQYFISAYLGDGIAEKCNPNLSKLDQFSERIMDLILEYEPSKYPIIRNNILELIDQFNLEDFLNSRENQLTVIYCIVSGVDAGVRNWDAKRCFSTFGPLDKNQKTPYRVYFNQLRTLHEDYISYVGRERIHTNSFFEQFDSFRFIDTNEWGEKKGLPQVKFVPNSKTDSNRDERKLSLRIGVCPGYKDRNFDFCGTTGSNFTVDYSGFDQKIILQKVTDTIEMAVREQCDILVFPEYMISREIHDAIAMKIRDIAEEQGADKNPILTFAGTTWECDDNNIMRILDCWGDELGRYFKYSSFVKPNKNGRGFEWYEPLSNPGKESDLFSVEGIGTFLPAICRDVIDGEHTDDLVKRFLPLMVIISAWSPSISMFEPRQRDYANKYFTSSLLANGCSAVDKTAISIGNGCIVYKHGTIADAEFCKLDRNNCDKSCGQGGCLFIVNYDFSFLENENTKIEIYKCNLESEN